VSEVAGQQPPPTIEDKRWAQLASEAPFKELAAVRAVAERWRNGLAALTTLLSAAALFASPALASHLAGWPRLAVGALALAGLLAFLYGTWCAMDAAFGTPGQDDYLSGPRLQRWEHDQAKDAVVKLRTARLAFVAGLSCTIAAAAFAFAFPPASSALTQAETVTGTFCGELSPSAGNTIAITGADGTVHTIPLGAVRKLQPVSGC
jgi:hypothetical protein